MKKEERHGFKDDVINTMKNDFLLGKNIGWQQERCGA